MRNSNFKYSFLLLILTLFSFQNLFSQKNSDIAELKVKYIMYLAADGDSIGAKSDYDFYDYTLLFNSTKSIYADEKLKGIYDYIRNNVGNYSQPRLDSGYPKSKSSIYKDGDKITATLRIGRNLYSFQEPLLQWELIPNEKKDILGYSCILAKTITDTGQLYYAWYTTKIPISDGPFRFKGLNGLVLEIYNEDKSLIIKSSSIEKSNDIIQPIQYITVYSVKNKADFLKKRKEFIDNPNSDEFSSKFKAYTLDGKEIKSNRRQPLKIKESVLLD